MPRGLLLAVLVTVPVLGMTLPVVGSEARAYTLAVGTLEATELEAQECYFKLGPGAMVALHPKSEACPLLRELVGRRGTLQFVLDEAQP